MNRRRNPDHTSIPPVLEAILLAALFGALLFGSAA